MKFRIVTAVLAAALAVWLTGGIAVAQVQEDAAQEGIRQEGILEFAPPAPQFNKALQSELPLQGVLDESMVQEATVSLSVPPAVAPRGLLDKLRRLPYDARSREIAGASVGVLALFAAGWMVSSAAFRRRARRSYRRFPRSSGGSHVRGLEQVVAAVQMGRATGVQMGRARRARRSSMHGSVAGRSR